MDYTKDAILIHELNKTVFKHHKHNIHYNHPPQHHGLNDEQQLNLVNNNSASPTNNFSDDIINNLLSLNSNSTTTSNDTLDYVPYEERIETYLVPVLFAIIFIIGVLGNGALIFIFIKHRTMRNVPNMYICSLAIGDILVIFFCVPFTSTVYTVEAWPFGLTVCKFSEFIKDVSIGVSVFTLTALSADRYFAIVDPMRKLAGRRATKITCLTIGGIWIASIIIALPSVLFSYLRVFSTGADSSFVACYPYPEEFGDIYPKVVVLSKALVYYVIPLIFITGFYSEMAHHLVLSTINMPGESQGQGRQIQARKKVAKMVLSFVVIFAMCFFLSHVFFLWFYFDPNSEENYNSFWNVVRILGFILSFLNSCINPITLYCVSGTFRKYFNQYLFCCLISKPHGRSTIKSTCCPNLGHPSRRNSFQNSTSFKSEGGGLHLFGNSTGGGARRNNGLCRASTLTSTTSLRTKVTWDTNRATTSSCSPSKRLLTSSNSSTPTHEGGGRRNTAVYNPSSSRNTSPLNQRKKSYIAHNASHLVPIESASDESYHLYENPNSNLLDKSNLVLLNETEPSTSAHANVFDPPAYSVTSFIENVATCPLENNSTVSPC